MTKKVYYITRVSKFLMHVNTKSKVNNISDKNIGQSLILVAKVSLGSSSTARLLHLSTKVHKHTRTRVHKTYITIQINVICFLFKV